MQKASEELRRCNHLINEIYAQYHNIAVKTGISDSVQCILYCVCENGESCPQSYIYKSTGISRQTINSATRRLEQDGILYLKQEKNRRTTIYLTDRGKLFAREKIEPILKIENEIFGGWTKEEREIYLRLIENFRDSLIRKTEEL